MVSERIDLDRDAAREEMAGLLEQGDVERAVARLLELHPADQADLVAELDAEERAQVLPRLPQDDLVEVLMFLKEEPRRAVVEEMAPALLAPLLDEVEQDVAVDVLRALPPERARATLGAMTTAAQVAPLLAHPDETAGGRMTGDFVALNKEWTVEQTLEYLRRTKPEAEQAYYLYVVDDEHRLEGVLSLRQLVVAAPDERVRDLMEPEVVSARAPDDQEAVARQAAHYDLVALPVVDDERHLVGVVTLDDLIDVVEEEATEDMYRLAGLSEDESVFSPVRVAARRRIPWLLVNLSTAFLTALVVSAFEDTIAKVAVLAAFMPVIAGHGGNTGTQAITLIVRGLALGEVRPADAMRIVGKEVRFGLVHGLITGTLTGAFAFVLTGNGWLMLVVFCAMLGNIIIAAAVGSLLPLAMRRLGIDPALASAIWLTTFTDVMGFVLLLGLGTLLVDRIG